MHAGESVAAKRAVAVKIVEVWEEGRPLVDEASESECYARTAVSFLHFKSAFFFFFWIPL
jgi:hypothetical protein